MKKYIFVVVLGLSVVGTVLFLTRDTSTKNGTFEASTEETEEVTEETTEAVKTAFIEVAEIEQEYLEGFPCGMPLEELTREEETESETVCEEITEEETVPPVTETTEAERVCVYSVNDDECDPCITDYLLGRLTEVGLESLMNICVAQMYQESRFNVYAENTNGQDKGILQFRLMYYKGANIFDPYEQIDFYVANLSRRLSSGEDILSAVSDHYTGECGYSAQYVADVYQWVEQIKIREVEK